MIYESSTLEGFIGQEKIKEDLRILISHSRTTGATFGHTVFLGMAGTGKTTLSEIIAKELDYDIARFFGGSFGKSTTGDIVNKVKFSEEKGKKIVIFIDEIHAIQPKFAEFLLLPMESFLYEGEPIPEFSLIAATTEFGKILKPLRRRFSNVYTLRNYTIDDLTKVLESYLCPSNIAPYIAERSRFTPSEVIKLFKRIKIEWSELSKERETGLTLDVCNRVFVRNGIDNLGLSPVDREIIKFLFDYGAYEGSKKIRPCGIENISVTCDLTRSDYLYLYEPFLVRGGFIRRIPKGRVITEKSLREVLHLEFKKEIPKLKEEITGDEISDEQLGS